MTTADKHNAVTLTDKMYVVPFTLIFMVTLPAVAVKVLRKRIGGFVRDMVHYT